MITKTLLAGFAGFSSGVALLLAVGLLTYWRRVGLSADARIGGILMLAGLTWTSWRHLHFVDLGPATAPPFDYVLVLSAHSVGFYLLAMGVLNPCQHRVRLWLPPVLIGMLVALLPPEAWRIPLVMMMGSAFALHLGLLLWRLRALRRWFRLELPIVCIFAVMALITAIQGFIVPTGVEWSTFALTFSAQIALGYGLVCVVLFIVPDIVDKTREAVDSAQSGSALARVDVNGAAIKVRALMEEQKLYRDETLTLGKLAEHVGLSNHQLSALLNQHFGFSFSSLLRRYRIAEAKKVLLHEPHASVLSVGMAVGFASQSTFYVAFKEEVGMVPGEFRRKSNVLASKKTPD